MRTATLDLSMVRSGVTGEILMEARLINFKSSSPNLRQTQTRDVTLSVLGMSLIYQRWL